MAQMYSKEWLQERGLVWTGNSLPFNPKLIERAREIRKNSTPAERKLWYDCLSKHESKFVRQKIVDHYIVDFYCAKFKLVIEVDGSHHYTESGIVYDQIRTDILSEYGLTVVRFANNDVLNHFPTVCNQINSFLNAS